MSDKYISVWYDETSAEHGWIVDCCDSDGASMTVKVFETEAEARQFAADLSAKTGLPVR